MLSARARRRPSSSFTIVNHDGGNDGGTDAGNGCRNGGGDGVGNDGVSDGYDGDGTVATIQSERGQARAGRVSCSSLYRCPCESSSVVKRR
eukprot:gene5566-biopygen184